MSITIPIRPRAERKLRDDAKAAGVSAEQLAARRVEEADLLWRIRTAAPQSETQRLHRLLRKAKVSALGDTDGDELQRLLDEREIRAAQRLEDLTALSKLTGEPVAELMDKLGIGPVPTP